MPIDYRVARAELETAFDSAETTLLADQSVDAHDQHVAEAVDTVFSSNTQAFREVLLGCLLARIQDKAIDVRKPYVSQGNDAYNGRTLDERVVNPVLQEKRIPSSKGPFLSVFRRSVEFRFNTRDGVRDKSAFDALLAVIEFIENTDDNDLLREALNFVAFRFVQLREAANIPLTRIHRMSLEQISALTSRLLEVPSGGRLPVYSVVSTFHAIDRHFDLGWDIQWQGINVADSASGAGGDIVVTSNKSILLAAEVTERPIDRNRVVTTFNSKIGPQGIEDYLFFVHSDSQQPDTATQVRQYFAQGHEINFVAIANWIVSVLVTIGSRGRSHFVDKFLELLELPDTPVAVRVAWNESIDWIVSRQ